MLSRNKDDLLCREKKNIWWSWGFQLFIFICFHWKRLILIFTAYFDKNKLLKSNASDTNIFLMIYNSSDGCFILREIKHLSSTFNELFLFRDLKKKKKKGKSKYNPDVRCNSHNYFVTSLTAFTVDCQVYASV